MINNIEFPNGFTSWHESHYEIVNAIAIECRKVEPCELVAETISRYGSKGLYEVARELTNQFEYRYLGIEWGIEIEFEEEMQTFIKIKL
jgi:hypothetical protein